MSSTVERSFAERMLDFPQRWIESLPLRHQTKLGLVSLVRLVKQVLRSRRIKGA